MIIISFVFLILVVRVEAIICPTGQQPCGSNGCYDPTVQGCTNDGTIIQCINSCNGTCYSTSQYCYNNTKVCNNGELICDVKTQNYISSFPLGLTCYNLSQLNCFDNNLCYQNYSCGTQCLPAYNSVCVKNQTICLGYPYWNTNVNVCGNQQQQQCYDNTTGVCLNGSIVCQGLNAQLCGMKCFTPDTQVCNNSNVQCINSCNGICYSNSQYCYNNTKVCNNGELVCDVTSQNSLPWVPLGVTCYNSSQFICFNNTLCSRYYSCETQCLPDYNSVCVKNETICQGFSYSNTNVNLCGNQQQCYDNTTSVCLNGSIVCQGLNAQLCGTKCFTPDKQVCINSNVECINSCNGTCYSNSQYCYNNTNVCNNGELICNVTNENYFHWVPLGVTCYNSSLLTCFNNTLCYQYYSCGAQCLSDYNSACVNNQKLCPGFFFWNTNVNVCGSQQQCYDSSISVCFGSNSTVCPIGNQLCSGVCYDPQSQYCTGGNITISCLNNASLSDCPVNSTGWTSSTSSTETTTTATYNTCCAVQNCTTNSDCCQLGQQECQCYRHNQTDVYGSCANPYVTPICGDTCPVQSRCKNDSDCCKCQCADVTFTDSDGQLFTNKQCVQR